MFVSQDPQVENIHEKMPLKLWHVNKRLLLHVYHCMLLEIISSYTEMVEVSRFHQTYSIIQQQYGHISNRIDK